MKLTAHLLPPPDVDVAPIIVIAHCDIACAGVLALHSLMSSSSRVFEIGFAQGNSSLISLPQGISSKIESIKPIQIKTFYSDSKASISFLTVNSKLSPSVGCILAHLLMDWFVWSENPKIETLFLLSSLPPSLLPHSLPQNKKYYYLPLYSDRNDSPFLEKIKQETRAEIEEVSTEKGLKLKSDGFLSTLIQLSLTHQLPSFCLFVKSAKLSWRTPLSSLFQAPKELISIICELFPFLKPLSDEQIQNHFIIHNTELQDDSNLYL